MPKVRVYGLDTRILVTMCRKYACPVCPAAPTAAEAAARVVASFKPDQSAPHTPKTVVALLPHLGEVAASWL